MTPEDKELLLKDLCGRLSHGIEISLTDGTSGIITSISIVPHGTFVTVYFDRDNVEDVPLEDVKPYLRPMSSMTYEEYRDGYNLGICLAYKDKKRVFDGIHGVGIEGQINAFDWLNAHHFDYRGLIEKRLALEASEGMYKNE